MWSRLALVAVGAAAAVGVAAWWWTSSDDEPPPPSAEDVALGLDHASVHLHVVLRRERQRDANLLEPVLSSEGAAERVADRLLRARVEGARMLAAGEALAPILGETTVDRERLFLLLALVEDRARHDDRVPLPISVYEASRLRVETLDEALHGIAHAARALVYSKSGRCDLTERESEAATRAPTAAEIRGWLPGLESETVADDLHHAIRFLVDASLACCAVREGALTESAKRIEASAADAEALRVDVRRVAILRAWAAVVRGDRARARTLVDGVNASQLADGDRERHRMVRDALATPYEEGVNDALVRLVDRDWLLALALEGTVDALARDGVLHVLGEQPQTQAAREFVRAEARVIAAARRLDPLFDLERNRR